MNAAEQELRDGAKIIAEEEDIPQYKALMLQYIQANAAENQASKTKERIKAIIKRRWSKTGKVADMVDIPDQKGRVALARLYEQGESKVNHELARSVLSDDLYAQIFYATKGERFTITGMDELAAKELMLKTVEYWTKKDEADAAELQKLTDTQPAT